ncbi:hypothetical protein [Nitrososphaera viennensis]|mgnify:CR=1 FL=1|uniref:Uncharacterized protein n=2 Tax=Nitrososphaera viennensis TaxID=1034015 RepID=A0A977NN36_9ARCH|nr:hypothetical protein [Nitrososphaera viennensis]AIC15181.1 putative Hsp90 domain protein [Nitrososphaera viennensis EN76]UVS70101.1 hypothetical protein NWT39_04755 [Nitrososphaera viennensis]
MTAAAAYTILEERKDMLVLILNGKVQTVPLTPYTEVKYKHFNGNRIAYRFNEEMEVQETYDDGIFNCSYKTAQMQIRKRDAIAEAILQHYRCGSTSTYERLFQLEYTDRNCIELLKFMLAGYRQRLRFEEKSNDEAIHIDGSFKVDRHGNAYVRDGHEYRRICIVVQGSLSETGVETPIGRIPLDETALTILAKTIFLLNPKLEDEVFRSQVPSQILAALEQSRGKAVSASP